MFHRVASILLAAVTCVAVLGCAGSSKVEQETTTVSGTPTGDAFAFEAAGRDVDAARFDRIRRRGPDEVGLSQAVGGGATGADRSQEVDIAPTTRPRLEVDPVSRSMLNDDRVRLIWHLQGGGASTVKSQPAAGRRTVNHTPTDLGPLVALVQAHLGEAGSVIPLPSDNRLVITCRVDAEAGVVSLLRDVDQPGRQVEIRARIFEVNHGYDYQQGFRLLAQRVAEDGTQTALSTFRTAELLEAAAGQPFQGSIVSVMQVLQDVGINLDASFELLAETGLINVVSEPRLTVAEGDTGYLLAGQEVPIQSADLVKGILSTKTQYKPVGVQLYVTPQIVGDGFVRLHALSVVSSVAGFTPLPTLAGSSDNQQSALLVNPVIDSREAETNVTVGDGETLVISGLRMVRTTTREDKVPGLGDLPVLGHLFKNHRTQRRMTDLYFFLTPTIIDHTGMASAR
jgi:type II secretory pathway component GspD/PulD (secretin)